MLTLSSKVGYVMNATSVRKSSWSTPGVSNTATCDNGPPVRSPTSLSNTLFKNVLESTSPFMYISAFPSCASFTAVRAAWFKSGSLMISYPSSRFIPISAAISRIFASSPTRIAFAMPFSFASFTAARTASSWAAATATVFISHSFTLPMIDSKLGFIPLLPLFFIISSNFS